MNLLCKMFGHRKYSGWWGDGLYGNLALDGVDGIGRQHAHVSGDCMRCGERYVMARLHMPSGTKEDTLKECREAVMNWAKQFPSYPEFDDMHNTAVDIDSVLAAIGRQG